MFQKFGFPGVCPLFGKGVGRPLKFVNIKLVLCVKFNCCIHNGWSVDIPRMKNIWQTGGWHGFDPLKTPVGLTCCRAKFGGSASMSLIAESLTENIFPLGSHSHDSWGQKSNWYLIV